METEKVPERPILAKCSGDFHVTVSARELLNGNKIHVILECPYDPTFMGELAFLHGKDARVGFKELAAQLSKKEKSAGQGTFEETPDGVGPTE
jgi:hypothetical protein